MNHEINTINNNNIEYNLKGIKKGNNSADNAMLTTQWALEHFVKVIMKALNICHG